MDLHVHWKNCSPSGESGVEIENGAIDESGAERRYRQGRQCDLRGYREADKHSRGAEFFHILRCFASSRTTFRHRIID